MTLLSLQALTWSTVTGAVLGAFLLASSPSAEAERNEPRRAPAAGTSKAAPGATRGARTPGVDTAGLAPVTDPARGLPAR
jgi:hypothetical protein